MFFAKIGFHRAMPLYFLGFVTNGAFSRVVPLSDFYKSWISGICAIRLFHRQVRQEIKMWQSLMAYDPNKANLLNTGWQHQDLRIHFYRWHHFHIGMFWYSIMILGLLLPLTSFSFFAALIQHHSLGRKQAPIFCLPARAEPICK